MPKCRICNAKESEQHLRAPNVFGGGDEHNFWQCNSCNSIYLYPIPTVEEEKKFYLEEFEDFMSTRVGDHRDWSNAEKQFAYAYDLIPEQEYRDALNKVAAKKISE